MKKSIIVCLFFVAIFGISTVNAEDKLEIFQDFSYEEKTTESNELYQVKLDAAVRGDKGTLLSDDSSLKWESSNPEIMTINEEGFVKILDYGKATITATYMIENKTYKGKVIINSKDRNSLKDDSFYINLNSQKEKINVGEKINLYATVWQHINETDIDKIVNDTELYIPKDVNYKLYLPEGIGEANINNNDREFFRGIINNQVNWKIENINDERSKDVLATIDQNGVLTAKKAGTIEVIAIDKNNKDTYDTISLDIVDKSIDNKNSSNLLKSSNEILNICVVMFTLIIEIVVIIVLLKKISQGGIK